jgi:prevent-host-death family protein
MKRRLSAVEARKKLGEILEGVYYRGDEVIIERAGKPMAVVIPVKIYEDQQRKREAAWTRIMEMTQKVHERNKDVPDEVIDAEIEAAVNAARMQMQAEREAKKRPEKTA